MPEDERGAKPRQRNEELPIVVFDRGGGLWVFRTHKDATSWMEAVDVADGEYHAYDNEGYLLDLSVVNDEVVIRRLTRRAYDDAVAQFRDALSNSPVVLTADTLEGMIRELLDLERTSRLIGRLSAVIERLLHRRRQP